MPSGHIPGSCNLPFFQLFNEDGSFKPSEELQVLFNAAGIDLDKPVIATCGSGVTACVLLFALDRIGASQTALYDGSWIDWGNDPATPNATSVEQ
jgi:thiosulfate/3-mercaptopyruvate sulfurtransferase